MPSSHSNLPAVGIDFGTTNSSVALARPGGAVELVSFRMAAAVTESFRSILYLEQHKHAGRTQIKSFTGPSGIEHYLDAEHKGRLIQSLKSYLTSRTLTGTEVFGRRYTLEDLISRILTDLRLQAEKQFNQPIRHATVGRPVRFVGAESESVHRLVADGQRLAYPSSGSDVDEGDEAGVVAVARREGTWAPIQPSKVATSGATPAEVGKTAGSSAGSLSMTVSRVSIVVPCRA